VTATIVDPDQLARRYVDEVRTEVQRLDGKIKVVGLMARNDAPSVAYARATQRKFDEIGIDYELRPIARLDLEAEIQRANDDARIHGVFIYFPIFHNEQDVYLRNLVDFRKDIEAGTHYWTRKLYANERYARDDDRSQKAVLPCTPLAVIKLLTGAGVYPEGVERPIAGYTATIFNRSEVNGRPLAVMLSNDGARVYSFDINGALAFERARPYETDVDRAQALAQSDIVITGVPSNQFERVHAAELKPGAICVNFSSYQNFAEDVVTTSAVFVPRVGPMTVAMVMRNTVRLYRTFHA
jgi:5,10-methylene-tetrahydrofolate dehydrogenase/methenyl tetrahydrofolate cyclohydrolase